MQTKVKTITSQELNQRRKQEPELALLDVREPHERDISKLQNDLHIPMGQIEERMHELQPDKTLVVYCRTGRRSMMVAGFLIEHGFADVYNLQGGIDAWAQEIDPSMPRY